MASLKEDISDVEDNHLNREAVAKYSPISESLRSSIPESQMCLMFCGGKNCKYETATKWKNDQAITGLYSSWITQNILAMSRPNTDMIDKFNIIQQFKDNNIKSLINLQMLGEHEHCGPGLESSGFTYQPQEFMDAQVSFYNYGWRDYGVGSMKNLVDVVQVMQFAISEGKVAIHCHAGLGRTGVLIACYLVYTNRTQPQVAINYIRSKRPGSIQSNCQIQCISDFYKILLPMRIIFNLPQSSVTSSCTLSEFLTRQKYFIHGREAKLLKHLPKIVFVCCNRLMDLAGVLCTKEEHITRRCAIDFFSSSKDQDSQKAEALSINHLSTTSETVSRSISSESFCPIPFLQKVFSNPDLPLVSSRSSTNDGKLERKGMSKSDVIKAMSKTTYDRKVLEALDDLRRELNSSDSGWKSLENEENPEVLSCILWSWIDDLKEPILTHQDLPVVIDETSSLKDKISLLEKCAVATISYLLLTCLALHPPSSKAQGKSGPNDIHFQLMQRIISTLVHQNCVLEGDDVTNDLDDEFFLRSSNQVGSVMRLDLGRRIYRFLLDFSHFLSQSGIICCCSGGRNKK